MELNELACSMLTSWSVSVSVAKNWPSLNQLSGGGRIRAKVSRLVCIRWALKGDQYSRYLHRRLARDDGTHGNGPHAFLEASTELEGVDF